METCPCCGAEIPYKTQITVEKYLDRKTKKWTEVMMDSHDVVVGKRVDEYTYYNESGKVKDIVQKKYDGKNLLIDSKTVSHTEDGNISTSVSVGG